MADSSGNQSKSRGVVAEYDTPEALIAAANRVREAGYTKTDAFSPFPVHGIDEAIGIKPTILPWIVLAAGTTGCLTGLTMETWMNAIDYPYIISGKPFLSLPAFIPVAFELTILFSAFAAFFGQWALNGLPKFSNAMFTSPRFDAATDDKFFLYIDSRDARFNDAGARALLADTSPANLEDVYEDESPTNVPRFIYLAVLVLAVLSVFPLLIIADMRVTKSSKPRFHIFWDMDFMPSKGPQEKTILFADGRTMRPNVPGTVMRGSGDLDVDDQTGIQLEAMAEGNRGDATQLVAFAQAGDAAAGEAADTTPWVEENPLTIDRATLDKGRERFDIYCAVCHGRDGFGNGLVNQRAKKILATTWTQPSSLHEERLAAGKMADGKIFNTITNGIRKMPGYAGQITVEDRWAIVAYLRVLQASRDVSIDEIPANKRSKLAREADQLKKQIEAEEAARLKKAAEAKPATEEAKPAAEEAKPASEEAKPAAEEAKPAAEEAKPAAEEAKPAAEEAKPATEEAKPATEEAKPATEEAKPATEDAKPATEDAKPAAEEAKPAAEETKPATEEAEPTAEGEASPDKE
ncbi:Surface protein precursor [Rosistilla carotiformis]|uniref:Surface protein n=1 Tax=Rosistilla carotiformis TaxID=2528017 RepID=A0A518JXV6_9BACT|nr:quinol:electron acceptor oxidoreductase subunit ActD [Rosistilla carotiformis]QDV70370.1 Surface protein precursor [Rosistilla carotiformis]